MGIILGLTLAGSFAGVWGIAFELPAVEPFGTCRVKPLLIPCAAGRREVGAAALLGPAALPAEVIETPRPGVTPRGAMGGPRSGSTLAM